jgi:hypothetical protein
VSASAATRRALVLLLACAPAALGLAACGGDDEEETTTSAAPAPAQTADGEGRGAGQGNGSGARASDEGQKGGVDLSVRPRSVEGARVTETGSVQTLPPSEKARQTAQKNTYGSIRSFGGETEGEGATEITFALVQYLDAKARGDWATACARLYSVLREGLEEQSKGGSCAEALGALMRRVPRSSRAEQARIDISSVRRGSGDRAFVIYKTPDTVSVDMPMYVEDGVWKVGALEAYALTPDQVG